MLLAKFNINRKDDFKRVKEDAERIRAEAKWDGRNSETFDKWEFVKDDVCDDDCNEWEGYNPDDGEGSGDEKDENEDMEDANDDKLPFKVIIDYEVLLILNLFNKRLEVECKTSIKQFIEDNDIDEVYLFFLN